HGYSGPNQSSGRTGLVDSVLLQVKSTAANLSRSLVPNLCCKPPTRLRGRPQRRIALYWEDGRWAPTIHTSTWISTREYSGRWWRDSVLCTVISSSLR